MFRKVFDFFEGKLSQSQKEELLDDIVKSDDTRYKYIEVKNFITKRRVANAKRNPVKEEAILNDLHLKLSINPIYRRAGWGKALAISASLAVVLGVTFFIIKITAGIKEDQAIEYMIAQNKMKEENSEVVIELSTGEKVNLDESSAGSNISVGKLSILSSGKQIQIASSEKPAGRSGLEGKAEKVPDTKMNSIHIKGKNDYLLTLEDGSKVWLRSNARFSFPDKFEEAVRNVALDGEAYFSVAKNDKKPFVITTGEADITVLGTEFNLKSKLNERNLELSMVTGHVALNTNGVSKLELVANEQLRMDMSNLKYTINAVDGYKYKAWTEGYFVFINEELSTILNTLSDWYEIDIELLSSKYDHQKFNGKFKVTKGLDNLIKTLQLSYDFSFYVKEKTLFIK